MSERFAWMFVLVITVAGGLGWSHYRRLQGRAEQKKEDAIWFAAHPVVKEEGQVLKPGWSRAIVTVHEPLAYHVAFEFLDGRREIYMACFSTPVRSLLDGQKIDVVYKLSDEDKDGNCLHIDSYLPVPAPPKKAKPAKANCSRSLNHGTATVYWPPREDGQCYSQDAPFQP